MISVLILTKNEEQDLPGCLDSVAWSDDVHVFDSFSTDRTLEIAQGRGAHINQRVFDGYASQLNFALQNLPFKYEWQLILDADERVTPALAAEMRAVVSDPPPGVNGWRIPIDYFLDDAPLRHSQMTSLYLRLVRRGMVRWEREINPVPRVEGEARDLKSPIDHYPFSKGIAHWVQRHNSYSTMEAEVIVSGQSLRAASIRTALFGKTYHEKRAARKALFYRMPGRPLIKWLYMMFVQGAILDGRAGLEYVNLQTIYEYLIVLKTREMLHRRATTSERP
jgi:glycosyltransferase involved in cell wall biosynthesis